MKLLLAFVLSLCSTVFGAVVPVPISAIPKTNATPGTADMIVNQAILGHATNDTFTTTVDQLFSNRLATNLNRRADGRMTGTESWISKSISLTNGVNFLPTMLNTAMRLISPSTNPLAVSIVLSNGVVDGQWLEIVNLTNSVPARGAFILTNGTPIAGGSGTVVLLGGEDWIATNGCQITLRFEDNDWREDGRVIPGQSPVIFPDTWHVVGGTNLQPVNLALQPLTETGWFIGTNSEALWGEDLSDGYGIVSYRIESTGEALNSGFFFESATDLTEQTNSTAWLRQGPYQTRFTTQSTIGANSYRSDLLQNSLSGVTRFHLLTNGVVLTRLEPTMLDAQTPYRFDTAFPHTSGNLLEVANNGTNHFTIGMSNLTFLAQGGTGSSWITFTNDQNSSYLNVGTDIAGHGIIDSSSPAIVLSVSGNQQLQLGFGSFNPNISNNISLGTGGASYKSAFIGSTNEWKLLGVTTGATTNISININGINYSFIAF